MKHRTRAFGSLPVLAVLFLLCFPILAPTPQGSNKQINACYWDSDTLAFEAKGLPGVVEAITGRFDRFPPIYYEKRIEIATAKLNANPLDLIAYDDIAVSYDKIGNSDLAIEWMQKKRNAIDNNIVFTTFCGCAEQCARCSDR